MDKKSLVTSSNSFFNLPSLAGKGGGFLVATTRKRSKDFFKTTIKERFSIAMCFTFVIFVLGLSISLRSRYKDQFLTRFIRNTLPGLGPVEEGTTWETFENILNEENKSQWIQDDIEGNGLPRGCNPYLERLDLYNDALVIKMREPWEKLKTQRYIGFYPLDSQKLQTKKGWTGLNYDSLASNSSGLLQMLQIPSRRFFKGRWGVNDRNAIQNTVADKKEIESLQKNLSSIQKRLYKIFLSVDEVPTKLGSPTDTPFRGFTSLNSSNSASQPTQSTPTNCSVDAPLKDYTKFLTTQKPEDRPHRIPIGSLPTPEKDSKKNRTRINASNFQTTEMEARESQEKPLLVGTNSRFLVGLGQSHLEDMATDVEKKERESVFRQGVMEVFDLGLALQGNARPLQEAAEDDLDPFESKELQRELKCEDDVTWENILEFVIESLPVNTTKEIIETLNEALWALPRGWGRGPYKTIYDASNTTIRRGLVDSSRGSANEETKASPLDSESLTSPLRFSLKNLVTLQSKHQLVTLRSDRSDDIDFLKKILKVKANLFNLFNVFLYGTSTADISTPTASKTHHLPIPLGSPSRLPNTVTHFKETKSRLMSGYTYPDLKKGDIEKRFMQLLVKNRVNWEEIPLVSLLGRKEVNLPPSLSSSDSLKSLMSLETFPLIRKEVFGHLPVAKIRYRGVVYNGLNELRTILSALKFDVTDDELEEIDICELAYFGPAATQDKTTKDVIPQNKREIDRGIATLLRKSDENIPFLDQKANFLGKKEVLWGEEVSREKLQLALQARPYNELSPLEASGVTGLEPNDSISQEPIKSGNLSFKNLFAGLEPKPTLLDPLITAAEEEEAPVHPVEIIVTKSPLLFNEEDEIVFLGAQEWSNILKSIITQALSGKADLDKIDILLPFITLAAPHGIEPLEEAGNKSEASQPLGTPQCNARTQKDPKSVASDDPFQGPFTGAEYQTLYGLVSATRSFVGETTYSPDPLLVCHYLPPSQAALMETSTRQTMSSALYKKQSTSFTYRYPLSKLHLLSTSQKRPLFHEVWEPVAPTSWMIVYKFCFAMWVQEMGKDFYKRYGKEIILYALHLFTALGFNAQDIIEELGLEDSSIRVIRKVDRRFADVAGITPLLPELAEIVWFLRSSGRGGQTPKGILLVGPPGTGKTFVVQAIAGEAKVPVIVQSASALTDPNQKQSGSQKLRDLFDQARQLSPCILFIDEIDTLGVSRPHVIGNTMGKDELLESLTSFVSPDSTKLTEVPPQLHYYQQFLPSPKNSRQGTDKNNDNDNDNDEDQLLYREGEGEEAPGLDPFVIEIIESHNQEHKSKLERLALLMQFLMEMDGLKSLQGVVVIGATNRPSVLDPAFTRPGRFEKTLCLQLPDRHKRIEILKLYAKKLSLSAITSQYTIRSSHTLLSFPLERCNVKGLMKKLMEVMMPLEKSPKPLSGTLPTNTFVNNVNKSHRFSKENSTHVAAKQSRLHQSFPGFLGGIPDETPWDYIANRTAGLSAAHLATAINQSSLKGIIDETGHTIETIEHGINRVLKRLSRHSHTTSPSDDERRSTAQGEASYIFCKQYVISSSDINFFINSFTLQSNVCDDNINSVDDNINSVDDNINSVDDNINSVDDNINSVDDNINSVDDNINSVDDLMENLDDAELLQVKNQEEERKKISNGNLQELTSQLVEILEDKTVWRLLGYAQDKKEKSYKNAQNRLLESSSDIRSSHTLQSNVKELMLSSHTLQSNVKELRKKLMYNLDDAEDVNKSHPNLQRFAFYQAGKAVLHTELPLHPSVSFLPLEPQIFHRSASDLSNLISPQGTSEPQRRVMLETRLIGVYAGKAGELLGLSQCHNVPREDKPDRDLKTEWTQEGSVFARPLVTRGYTFVKKGIEKSDQGQFPISPGSKPLSNEESELGNRDLAGSLARKGLSLQSDLGVEELSFAGLLANHMITTWYLYSKKISLQKVTLAHISQEKSEIEIDDPVLLDLFRHLERTIEDEVRLAGRASFRYQQRFAPSWWQTHTMGEESLVEPKESNWYRLYIPDPEETERNIDWVAPDDHYHSVAANLLRNTSQNIVSRSIKQKRTFANRMGKGYPTGLSVTWNDLYLINRDYIYQGLVSSCFHKAINLLDKKRELLDLFADQLIRYNLLRQHEIGIIWQQFHTVAVSTTKSNQISPNMTLSPSSEKRVAKEDVQSVTPESFKHLTSPNDPEKIQGVSKVKQQWGSYSRREKAKFIDFDFVKPCFLTKRDVANKEEKEEKNVKSIKEGSVDPSQRDED